MTCSVPVMAQAFPLLQLSPILPTSTVKAHDQNSPSVHVNWPFVMWFGMCELEETTSGGDTILLPSFPKSLHHRFAPPRLPSVSVSIPISFITQRLELKVQKETQHVTSSIPSISLRHRQSKTRDGTIHYSIQDEK